MDGALVGSNFVTHWGSVGYFGPLTVHPDFWDRGVAQKLLEPSPGLIRGLGLPPHRPLHLLRQPQAPGALSEIRLLAPVAHGHPGKSGPAGGEGRGGQLLFPGAGTRAPRAGGHGSRAHRRHLSRAGRGRPRGGLEDQHLGDTVFDLGRSRPGGVRRGPRGHQFEAGSGCGYIKFGAARPGLKAGEYFDRLLMACESYATAQGAQRLIAGVSLARQPAYERLRAGALGPNRRGVDA